MADPMMIAPYAHITTLEEARPEALAEMMALAARAERAFARNVTQWA